MHIHLFIRLLPSVLSYKHIWKKFTNKWECVTTENTVASWKCVKLRIAPCLHQALHYFDIYDMYFLYFSSFLVSPLVLSRN